MIEGIFAAALGVLHAHDKAAGGEKVILGSCDTARRDGIVLGIAVLRQNGSAGKLRVERRQQLLQKRPDAL